MTAVPRELLRVGDRIIMAGTLAERPDPCVSNHGCLYWVSNDGGGTLFRCDAYAGGGAAWVQAAPGVSEAFVKSGLLDGNWHNDTLAGTVAQGDVIVGNSTPKWSRLAVGSSSAVLVTNGSDVVWRYSAPMTVWSVASATGVQDAALSAGFATAKTYTVDSAAGGGGPFREDVGGSAIVPGGWLTGLSSLKHRFSVEAYRSSGSGSIEYRLQDVTNGNTIASITGITAASRTFYSTTSFSNIPSGDAMVELQSRYVSSFSRSQFYGGSWHAQIDPTVS